ncbi:hypothetical protein D9Q98_005505 [Chlorella vulgaris]|uniref:GPI inositol-deacylase n=1 Tax=Chlorella vulgaris TaxID=3077 RepID=A0A9D4TM99_CHLVU|nr:hypothetical protein D9Q98_005505 [Chlorella vulgaris]
MVANLWAKGFAAEVLPMAVSDWTPTIFRGDSFEWYLERLDAVLQACYAKHGRVALVGHSAGGWIARILLGSEPYQGVRYGRSSMVHTLLTLGSPHQSIEAYPFGRVQEALTGPNLDHLAAGVRGSSLQFTNHFYPTADSLGGGVRVVCACGNAVRGRLLWATDGSPSSSSPNPSSSSGSIEAGSSITRLDQYFAYESYKCNCGHGEVDGDGVTPLSIAFLAGAEQLVLPGVWHNPRRKPGQIWYGDAAAMEPWLQYLHVPQGSEWSSS